jgi:nitrate/TMAO reductase-like tetraheme cytochrome c subunit
VLGSDDPRSPTFTLNVARLCGSCHGQPKIIKTYFKDPADSNARTAVATFKRSVHGTALSKAGLVVTATCNDCHGSHLVLPADSTASSISRPNVASTCGACHAGVLAAYDSSSHGKALATGDTTETGKKAPVCVDCHGGHKMVAADDPEWFRGTVRECGSCHQRLLETYAETYHGQVTAVGGELAARCSDCHTAHAMLPAKDPKSSVNKANLVETCARCHEGANAKFAQFRVHADVRDRSKNPVLYWVWRIMTTIMLGTFTVFGIHSILYFIRLKRDKHHGHGIKHNEGPDPYLPPKVTTPEGETVATKAAPTTGTSPAPEPPPASSGPADPDTTEKP